MGTFSDRVGEWAAATENRLDAVYARWIELLADELALTHAYGGRLPHRTGNLMRSLLGSTSAMPSEDKGPFVGWDVGLLAATVKYGQDVWLGYQAVYARRMNYGFKGTDSLGRVYNQEGYHFVEQTIANAGILLDLAVADVKTRAGGT